MTQPVQPRPQPVVREFNIQGAVSGLIVAIGEIAFIVRDGITVDNLFTLGNLVATVISIGLGAYVWYSARVHGQVAAAQVTPLESPQDYRGNPLLTADQWERAAVRVGKHSEFHAPVADDPAPTQYYQRLGQDQRPTPYPRRRLGRLPNDPSKPRVRLTALEAPATYTPPPSVDWYSKVPAASWGMDGNDGAGDCTFAELDHCVKALQVAAGNPEVRSTADEVLGAYSVVTGYDPRQTRPDGSNPTDNGAVMQDVRNYWRKNGVQLGGQRHTILLFAQVDHANHNLIKWCIARFGEVGIGFNFPASAMQQFDAGQPWTVVAGSKIEGGHAVGAVGYDADYVYVPTWGAVQKMAWSFFDKYVDECWTQLSEEFVSGTSGNDPLAETAYQLGQQYEAVTGQPNPIPAPAPAPSPAPVPDPVPTPNPGPDPRIPAGMIEWARHTLNLKNQSHATIAVAHEILGLAGQ